LSLIFFVLAHIMHEMHYGVVISISYMPQIQVFGTIATVDTSYFLFCVA